MKEVFTVIESNNKEGKALWIRVGVAFVNKDGSLNVKLNCLPVNGSLHIRDRKEKEAR
jgi:hypothetical protein